MSSNIFLDEFMSKKGGDGNSISLTKNNCIRISQNIVDINPVPVYVNSNLQDFDMINTEFIVLSMDMDERNLYVNKNQDPNKEFGIFTSQNAYVPYNNILSVENIYINKLKDHILKGIGEFLIALYGKREFNYNILNSWMQKYKNGTFLSPHNHLSSGSANQTGPDATKPNVKTFSVAYYIDDGDPDVEQSYSGCISFISNNNLIHVRPKTGTLLIWEDHLIHLVNPFYSKSGKERFMLSTNIMVYF